MSVFDLDRPVTHAEAKFAFWDVESQDNAFTVAIYHPEGYRNQQGPTVEVFILVDDPALVDGQSMITEILRVNPTLPAGTRVQLHDLCQPFGLLRLASMLGLSDAERVSDPTSGSSYPVRLRPTCDTDAGYDPFGRDPFWVSYNGRFYDTVIMALFFMEAFNPMRVALQALREGQPDLEPDESQCLQLLTDNPPNVSARRMREHNDEMFSPEYRKNMWKLLTEKHRSTANLIQRAMYGSGRHIDVTGYRPGMIALKRQLGLLGRQVLESDKLSGEDTALHSAQELTELVAYNVADVVGLAKLFDDRIYSGEFDLKHKLMVQYPETVFDRDHSNPRHHTPRVDASAVRWARLTPDSTSAQFAAKVYAPYQSLVDIEAVSFDYPHPERAAELGVTPINVLEHCREFFTEHFGHLPEVMAQFMNVYHWYADIQGRNFNDSPAYQEAHPDSQVALTESVEKVLARPNNLPYFDAEGHPTSAFVTFSTGGIHGAEYNVQGLQEIQDKNARIERAIARQEYAKQQVDGDALEMRKLRKVPGPDGPEDVITWNEVLKSNANISRGRAEWKDLATGRKELFEPLESGATTLNNKLKWTSVGHVIHEDFSSYYPNMLMNMKALNNPHLPTDRQAELYADKERLGAILKNDTSLTPAERESIKLTRGGVKLLLNAATGAGDSKGRATIRMNNQIISMRLIGQMLTWLVGQTQALHGAQVVSTNTDGLYVKGDLQMVSRTLTELSRLIAVEIEPEELFLVSKDSNNRAEFAFSGSMAQAEAEGRVQRLEDGRVLVDPDDLVVVGASGGSLACHNGPRLDKSLAHPAIIDHVLVHYLRHVVAGTTTHSQTGEPITISDPMDTELAMRILHERWMKLAIDPVGTARMFQNVVAVSSTSISVPFSRRLLADGSRSEATALQKTNRIFAVRPDTPGAMMLERAVAKAIPAHIKAKRAADPSVKPYLDEPEAVQVLRVSGYSRANEEIGPDKDIKIESIPGIDPEQSYVLENRDLYEIEATELITLLAGMDLEVYLEACVRSFNENWRNPEPQVSPETETTQTGQQTEQEQ